MFTQINKSLRGLFLALFEKPKKHKKHHYALAEALFLRLKVQYGIHGTSTFNGLRHMKYFSTDIKIGENVYTAHETHCPYGSKTFAIGNKKGGAPLLVVTSIPVSNGSSLYQDKISPFSEKLLSDSGLYHAVVMVLIQEHKAPLVFLPAIKQQVMFDSEKSWKVFKGGIPKAA